MIACLAGKENNKPGGESAVGILLVEPAIVPDTFVCGIEPEDLGNGNLRLTCYTRQKQFNEFEGFEYVTVGKLIVPVPVSFLLVQSIMSATGIPCCGGQRLMRLAH